MSLILNTEYQSNIQAFATYSNKIMFLCFNEETGSNELYRYTINDMFVLTQKEELKNINISALCKVTEMIIKGDEVIIFGSKEIISFKLEDIRGGYITDTSIISIRDLLRNLKNTINYQRVQSKRILSCNLCSVIIVGEKVFLGVNLTREQNKQVIRNCIIIQGILDSSVAYFHITDETLVVDDYYLNKKAGEENLPYQRLISFSYNNNTLYVATTDDCHSYLWSYTYLPHIKDFVVVPILYTNVVEQIISKIQVINNNLYISFNSKKVGNDLKQIKISDLLS